MRRRAARDSLPRLFSATLRNSSQGKLHVWIPDVSMRWLSDVMRCQNGVPSLIYCTDVPLNQPHTIQRCVPPIQHAWQCQPHPGCVRGVFRPFMWSLPGDRFVTLVLRGTDGMARTRIRVYIDYSTGEIRVFRPGRGGMYTFTLSCCWVMVLNLCVVAPQIAWRLGEIQKVVVREGVPPKRRV